MIEPKVNTSKRLFTVRELMEYTTLGRNRAIDFGEKYGARVKIGRRVMYDRARIDAAIDDLREAANRGE